MHFFMHSLLNPKINLTLFMVVKLYCKMDFMESISERLVSYRASLKTVIKPHVNVWGAMYWPTCLLCCLVFRRTIWRMLELVMSDTTSDTRFQTRSRAPHNMWYWRRRMPCRHSWPSSIFLHFPFLRKWRKRAHKINQKKTLHGQNFINSSLVVWWHMRDLQVISSWLVLRWPANPWECHLTLNHPDWILISTSLIGCIEPLILRDTLDSCLPVGMATFLEGKGELVLPAVPGFLWSHLEKETYNWNQQRTHHKHILVQHN